MFPLQNVTSQNTRRMNHSYVCILSITMIQLNDCIRNTTAVCNPRQNSVQDQIQSETKYSLRLYLEKSEKNIFCQEKFLKKNIVRKFCLRSCLGFPVHKVSCLGPIAAYHN